MGKSQRDKGARFERECVNLLKEAGRDAKRVPLSGAADGFKGDIICDGLILECKKRASGFKQIRSWLEGNDALIIGSDREEPLVVLRFRDWV